MSKTADELEELIRRLADRVDALEELVVGSLAQDLHKVSRKLKRIAPRDTLKSTETPRQRPFAASRHPEVQMTVTRQGKIVARRRVGR